ncbi:hypothetical protein V6N13_078488 [Hibiscus sabdariffa]|uniref:Uncharacterized protein n=1 Tax=Hibiscus sabdariffa TaxID=183260 RepID=A0ABR2RP95_9ROSI
MPFPRRGRTSACGVVQPMGGVALTPPLFSAPYCFASFPFLFRPDNEDAALPPPWKDFSLWCGSTHGRSRPHPPPPIVQCPRVRFLLPLAGRGELLLGRGKGKVIND